MRFVVLLLALAGCVRQQVPQNLPRVQMTHVCPPAPKPPMALPKIVTTEQLRAWAEATEKARLDTVEALRKCRRVRMVDQN